MSKKEKTQTFDELMKLAHDYQVEDNALFIATAEQYTIQIKVIKMIKEQLDADGSATTTKEYVRGRENVYTNPLIKELPKHADSANRSLQTMLDIIIKLGHKTEKASALSEFDKEFE